MEAAVVPTSLQNIGEANQICVNIGMRVPERIPYPGLRGEVDDDAESMPCEQLRNRDAIRQIQLFELKARIVAEDIEPGRLQPRIIISIEVIDPDDAVAGLQQPLHHVESDEARSSRYQSCLIRHYHPCILNLPMSWRRIRVST